jgi:hypothetical protein
MGKYSDDLEKRLRGPGFEAAKNKLISDFAKQASERGSEKAAEVSKGFDGKGKKNIYQCQTCLGLICTVDRDKGVTPFMIDCKSTPGCKGPMQSSFYMTHPMLVPTFEWFRPSGEELAATCASLTGPYAEQRTAAYVDHVNRGGLILRPIMREVAS